MVAADLEVYIIKTSWEIHENNDFQASSELILEDFTFLFSCMCVLVYANA